MVKRFGPNGLTTGWISNKPTREELERLTVSQLLLIAREKKSLKKILINFLCQEQIK